MQNLAFKPVSIEIRCDECKDETGNIAALFCNGRAQLPISVYVDGGCAEVIEIGIVEKKMAKNLNPVNFYGEYPMRNKFSVYRNATYTQRVYMAHPKNSYHHFSDDMKAARAKFLLTYRDDNVPPGLSYPVDLMAFAKLRNFTPYINDSPQDLVIFSVMNAFVKSKNEADLHLKSNSFITIELFWKPHIRIKTTNDPIVSCSAAEIAPKAGMIYRFYAEYQSPAIHKMELKSVDVSICNVHGQEDNINKETYVKAHGAEVFAFEGGSDRLCAGLIHCKDETSCVKVPAKTFHMVYAVTKGDAVACISTFYHWDAKFLYWPSDHASYSLMPKIAVMDIYGSCTRMTLAFECSMENCWAAIYEMSCVVLH